MFYCAPDIGFGPPFKPDLIIDFDYNDGKIDIKMIFPKEGYASDSLFAAEDFINPEAFLSRLMNIQLFFEGWFRKRMEVKSDGEVSIYVVARVFDGRVTYGSINTFRKCLGAALKNVKSQKLKVYWFDDYFKKEHKHKQEVPPEIQGKSRSITA